MESEAGQGLGCAKGTDVGKGHDKQVINEFLLCVLLGAICEIFSCIRGTC